MRWSITPFLLAGALLAQPPVPKPEGLTPLRFLEGTWTGEGTGRPGQSVGEATFTFELGGRVLVRRSYADTPAVEGRPAARHEDLTTFFAEGGQVKALYVDNEEHVIRYQVSSTPEAVVMTSEPGPGMKFRLTYRRTGPDSVALLFEIGMPGSTGAFSKYLEAGLRRVK